MVKVQEIMKTHVITADADTDMSILTKMMTNNKVGSVVLVKEDKPVDIVTADDVVFMVSKGLSAKKTKAKDLHKERKKLLTIGPDENILSVAKKMIKLGVKRFPVVRKDGTLAGIISEKEILLVSPELIEILSEKLKEKVDSVPGYSGEISGVCEVCGQYSDKLTNEAGRWICAECMRKKF